MVVGHVDSIFADAALILSLSDVVGAFGSPTATKSHSDERELGVDALRPLPIYT